MDKPTRYKATEQIVSNFQKNGKAVVYLEKGETVELVADHVEVLIVQRLNGKRIPVRKELMQPIKEEVVMK